MSELFSLFDGAASEPEPATTAGPVMMTPAQRAELKELFSQLGVSTAAEQFRAVHELTGVRISNVGELQGAHAHRAIEGLRKRVASLGTVRTGNSWDDREEPTWLDNL
ncbi:hypothetical protein [Microbacterium sp. Mcb102]|uniref:hypothetical protein n=1 Tax=Microbacterium sp. Mcb102 TaxID=2926012 RepID=UPI0021CA08CB|nr:hypothetical protein [Microbacterium sp. Mcb102]